jgi:hypothetical protein
VVALGSGDYIAPTNFMVLPATESRYDLDFCKRLNLNLLRRTSLIDWLQ